MRHCTSELRQAAAGISREDDMEVGLGLRSMAPRAQSTSGCWGGSDEHPWVQGQAGLTQLAVLALPHLNICFLHH